MPATQAFIDQLIQTINDAIAAGSVSNVMVATVLDFLNRKLQEVSQATSDITENLENLEAVKLKDPVLIWGNSFDGSADVNGDMHFTNVVCSFIFGDNQYRLEVVNLGTAASPQYALHSTLPFYSDSWVASGGVGSPGEGGGGGATSLVDLEDVDVEEAQNGDILQYDGEHWTAQTLPAFNTDKHHTHRQDEASDVWTIDHGLGKFPSVTVVDSCGNVVVGDVTYTSLNQLTVTFNAVFSGKAYLN